MKREYSRLRKLRLADPWNIPTFASYSWLIPGMFYRTYPRARTYSLTAALRTRRRPCRRPYWNIPRLQGGNLSSHAIGSGVRYMPSPLTRLALAS
eukprot:7096373-Pyramimonas_sp.AAC.1